jgi:Ca2+-binding RTX toxin-like protein
MASATKDLLVGGLGSDLVAGDGGDDVLFGGGDVIYGGAELVNDFETVPINI